MWKNIIQKVRYIRVKDIKDLGIAAFSFPNDPGPGYRIHVEVYPEITVIPNTEKYEYSFQVSSGMQYLMDTISISNDAVNKTMELYKSILTSFINKGCVYRKRF